MPVAVAGGARGCSLAQPPRRRRHRTWRTRRTPTRASTRSPSRCAGCHDAGNDGARDRYALNRHTPEEVLASITTGSMARYAQGLTEFEKRVVAVYIGGRPLGAAATGDASQMKNGCASRPPFEPFKGSAWNGWGFDGGNSRFQTSPGLTAVRRAEARAEVGVRFSERQLRLRTADGRRRQGVRGRGHRFRVCAGRGDADASTGRSAPTPVCGRRSASGEVSRANRFLAYFGDVKGNVYAVDAETGGLIWRDRVDTHPVARVTGAPTLVAGRLYVPMSSLEESGAGNPSYPCCTFRGGVVAYDAATGRRLWTAYTIPERPIPLKKTSKGTQLWGPAGAGVWSSPTVDLKRRAVYVATGNGYTEPAANTSDAVIAFDLDTRQTSMGQASDGRRRLRPRLPWEIPPARAERQQIGNVSR